MQPVQLLELHMGTRCGVDGGGGGGWYGGQASQYTTTGGGEGARADWGRDCSGAGGSGYVGGVENGTTTGAAWKGYGGYAKITLEATFIDGTAAHGVKAPDRARPDMPTNGRHTETKTNSIVMAWDIPKDNGTTYYHKAESRLVSNIFNITNTSNVTADTITSGLAGYRYYIDNNPTGTVGSGNAFTGTNSLEITRGAGKYLHVAAVDRAGNISGTLNVKIPWQIVTHYLPNDLSVNVYGDTVTSLVKGSIKDNITETGRKWVVKPNATNPATGDIEYTRKGYEFAGWNLQSSVTAGGDSTGENGRQYTGEFIPVGTELDFDYVANTYGYEISLYAVWEPIKYKVKFHGNDNWNKDEVGEEIQDEREYRYDKPMELPPNTFEREEGQPWDDIPQKQEYVYIGWGLTPEQHEPDFLDKEGVVNLTDKDGDTVDIYALWRKDLVLSFDLNGGMYRNSKDTVQLKASVFNSRRNYVFDVLEGKTPANLPRWTEQENTIDAYGTWNSNGINSKHTKTDEEGSQYRFLGWSLDKNAAVPDADWVAFDISGRNKKYSIEYNTPIYAVWEPILVADITFKRALGDNTFKDGTRPVSGTGNLTADMPLQKIEAIMTAGEQGEYSIIAQGAEIKNTLIYFDDAITQIYNNGSDKQYYDKLNPPTPENMETDQKHGLNRSIFTDTAGSAVTRKFYVPQYLGTDRSYPGNSGVNKYTVDLIVSQHSFFYETVHNKPETIKVQAVLHLPDTGKSVLPGPEPTPTPDGGGGGENPDNPGGEGGDGDKNESTTITEFRTNILN